MKERTKFAAGGIDHRVRGEKDPSALITALWLAIAYKDQGQYDKAEEPFIKAVKGRVRLYGERHPRTLPAMNELIDLYEAWNKPEKPTNGEQNCRKQKL